MLLYAYGLWHVTSFVGEDDASLCTCHIPIPALLGVLLGSSCPCTFLFIFTYEFN